MIENAGTSGVRAGLRAGGRTIAALLLTLLSAAPTWAHLNDGKIRGTCTMINNGGRGTMTVRIENLWESSVFNLEPTDLLGSRTGTAEFFIQTFPRGIRELLPGKSAELEWRGRLYGDGLLDLSVQIGAETSDSSEATGIINCNRISVGNPGGEETPNQGPATPTRTARPDDTQGPDPTSTIRPTDPAGRPTRTPIPQRPTRTPRVDPTRTNTPVKTSTPVRPTATFTRVPPTNTPRVRPTRTEIPDRPTRTPIVLPTRVSTATQPPRPTATRTLSRPTATQVPARPTRTRAPDPTVRPTRTPIAIPPTATRTPTQGGGEPGGGGLVANCSLRRNIDFVTITMIVENRTGGDIRQVTASPLSLEPEGGSLFFDPTGPSPGQVPQLRPGNSVAFQWTGRLSPGGTMGFSATAAGNGPTGPLRTPLIDCGVTGSDAQNFDPSSFSGTCNIKPGADGELIFEVRNGSRENLDHVEAFLVGRDATGSAQLLEVRGPAPRNVRGLSPGSRREFLWTAKVLGDGELTVQFEARANRVTTERISTGKISCTAQLGIAGGGSLPDLGVDEADQRNSTYIEFRDFGSDHCAVVEQCVSGTGRRRLLRFNTTTPNYGPGDVFVGDPARNPRAIYSSCHNHFHVQDYADYRLLDMGGNLVARGHKQAFCLVDLWAPPGLGGDRNPTYVDCGFQGISAGWADVYHSGLDCQWIDITGVPSGRYVLEVIVNPARTIQETNYSNNTARTEVTIP